ncbi:MAG TPA: SHOCT domain-containing protein [Acidimicrobiales bacterium]
MPPIRFHQQFFGGGPGRGGGIFLLLFLVLVVLVIVWAISAFSHRRNHLHYGPGAIGPKGYGPHANPEAQRILEERFARGEIDADEFKQKRDILRDHA